jgi:DNA-binding beta-propeller fold protein YncE
MIRSISLPSVGAILLLASTALPAAAQTSPAPAFTILDRIALPDGQWDYSSVATDPHQLLIARGNGVTAVALDTKRVTPTLTEGDKLHSALALPGGTRAAATDGGSDSVTLFQTGTGKIDAHVAVGKKPDGAVVEPKTGLLVVMNGASRDASLVDTARAETVATLPVGGKPEFPAADGAGLVYVNIEDTAQILALDIVNRKRLGTIALPGCTEPTGLAYDRADGLLISSCRNGIAAIVDAKAGKLIASISIGEGPDAVILDEPHRRAFIPSGISGTLAVLALGGADRAKLVQTLQTQPGTRTGAFDATTGRLYLTTARFAVDGSKKRQIVPGSVELLVVGEAK